MKKFLKVLGGILIALILIVVGAFFWLFSSSGNAFLKNAFQLSSSTEDWTTLFTINNNDSEQIEEMQNFIKEYVK